MRALLLVLLALATAVAQVAVAPFFPVLGAVAEFPVVALMLLAIFAGPHAVMIAFPILVLFLGFSTNVELAWLLVPPPPAPLPAPRPLPCLLHQRGF